MKSILLIEDEKEMAEMTKVVLESAGYLVHLTFDGVEGLSSAQKINPDLILLDLKIPKIDGYKVCEILKSNENLKNIPVIMLTSRNADIEQQIGYAMGADDYMLKPYEPEILLSKIKGFITK